MFNKKEVKKCREGMILYMQNCMRRKKKFNATKRLAYNFAASKNFSNSPK